MNALYHPAHLTCLRVIVGRIVINTRNTINTTFKRITVTQGKIEIEEYNDILKILK